MRKISKSVRREAFEYASIMATLRASIPGSVEQDALMDALDAAGGNSLAWTARWSAEHDKSGSASEASARAWGEAAAMLLEGWSPS